MTEEPAAVVTGVSSGIGRAIATTLAARGFTVFGTVRRAADAAAFEAAMGGHGRPLLMDVTDGASVAAAAAAVDSALASRGLTGLVNNAGIAVPAPLAHLPLDRFRAQLEVNLTGVLAVTQAFLPLLRRPGASGRRGRIVNVTSVSGITPMPFTGPYAASKAALAALTESLRRELILEGIGVFEVVPASIRTPMWEKGDTESLAPYDGTPYAPVLPAFKRIALETGRGGLPAERVATAVARALTAARPPLRTVVDGRRFTSAILRLLPRRLVDRLVARALGYPKGS